MKKIINKIRNEEGIALPIVLILMVVGGLIIAPLLSYISSGLLVGQKYEAIADELYAADAGVEDGLWQITYNHLDDLFSDYDPYDYDAEYDYPASYPVVVNDLDVDVTVENVWVPDIDEPADADEARQIIGAGKLIITGNIPAEYTHQIKIYYYREGTETLQINKIGIWIPPGFNYDVTGECTLETHLDSIDKSYSREIYPHCGGEAVVWTLTDVLFTDLPGFVAMEFPWASTITFNYATNLENRHPEAISWITTSGVSDIPYAWDADVKVYHIISEAGGLGGTTVEAYAIKSELRELGSAIAGDYRAIGNTLMIEGTGHGSNPYDIRYELLEDSDATADDIPSTARVEAAYLYWSAWVLEEQEDVRFWDDCTDIDNGNWNYGGDWHQYIGQSAFYAHHGPGHRRLEMANQINLSGYESGTVTASWRNWTYRNRQEGGDCIQYAFGDSGGWGDWQTAFCGNFGRTPQNYSVTIPDEYLVSDFQMRFKITGFGGSQERCYIDNIKISAPLEIADTSVVFKIDGVQVYFADDGEGNLIVPTIGTEEITADEWQVLENFTGDGDPHGFSYSSFKDVTGLLQEFTENGNATYTVGEVYGDTEDQWSYAAWSLIIIYASPETKGHQLYLYDDFIYSDMDCNVDFDPDVAPGPGGTISGFLVPEPIAGEVNAAKITCFVGEGDECWGGGADGWDDIDFLALNAPDNDPPTSIPNSYKLWDGTTGDSLNNVWNSKSLEITEDGIDIDTFYVTWASDLLEPGDTSAQVDMYTGTDSWNLMYIILSFRSETTTGGTVTYLIWE